MRAWLWPGWQRRSWSAISPRARSWDEAGDPRQPHSQSGRNEQDEASTWVNTGVVLSVDLDSGARLTRRPYGGGGGSERVDRPGRPRGVKSGDGGQAAQDDGGERVGEFLVTVVDEAPLFHAV